MELKHKEKLVKELYEKYPYPSRQINSAVEITYFAEWVARVFGETKEYWKGKTILELGCGTGELACALALCGANVIAVDFSASSIKHAKMLAKKFKVEKKVEFIEKNILELSENEFARGKNKLRAKKFDCVIALGSLHHTINALKGFQIACTYAKPNGLVIIGLYNKYARLRHRIKRSFLHAFAGNNIEKRITLGEKLFGGKEKHEKNVSKNNQHGKTWSADKYGQVHESYHSVGELMYWFRKEGIEFIASKPKFERAVIDELKWLLEKRGAFFVMTGKRKSSKED